MAQMSRKELYDWLAAFDETAPPVISTDTAFSLLDGSSLYHTPLDPAVVAFLSATIGKDAPAGWVTTVEVRPDGYRITNKKRDRMLPAESGDETP